MGSGSLISGLGLLLFTGDFEGDFFKSIIDEFNGFRSSEEDKLDEEDDELLEDDDRFLLIVFVYLKKYSLV